MNSTYAETHALKSDQWSGGEVLWIQVGTGAHEQWERFATYLPSVVQFDARIRRDFLPIMLGQIEHSLLTQVKKTQASIYQSWAIEIKAACEFYTRHALGWSFSRPHLSPDLEAYRKRLEQEEFEHYMRTKEFKFPKGVMVNA